MSMLYRYTFGKPVAGKLTVNMTVNGVGYYRHEMGHPVIKTMEVSSLIPLSTTLNFASPQNTIMIIHDPNPGARITFYTFSIPHHSSAVLRSKALQTSACVSRT